MNSGIYRDGGKLGMKPHFRFIEEAQTPFVCKKHKEIKQYDTFYREWQCETCWAETHKKAVIYQLKPIRRKIE